MSYQIIHTNVYHRQGEIATNAEVLARSVRFPVQLEKKLFKQAGRAVPEEMGLCGPCYSYHCVGEASERLHILTCSTCKGGGEAATTLVHHIVLTEAELLTLRAAKRPVTPAGIALLLEQQRVWIHSELDLMQRESDTSVLRLAVSCPDSDNHPAWFIFTGDNANAHILANPPYSEGCLLLVPPGTWTRDLLRLIHESDSLDGQRGWGTPFCTHANKTDATCVKQRLFCAAQAPLHEFEQATHLPVLEIKRGIRGQETISAKPLQAVPRESTLMAKPLEGSTGHVSPPSTSRLESLPQPFCRYTEYTNENLIELSSPDQLASSRSWLFSIVGTTAVASIIISTALWFFFGGGNDGEEEEWSNIPFLHHQAAPELPTEEQTEEVTLEDNIEPSRQEESSAQPSVPHKEPAPETATASTQPGSVQPPGDTSAEQVSSPNPSPSPLPGKMKAYFSGNTLPSELLPEDTAEFTSGRLILWYRTDTSSSGIPKQQIVILKEGENSLRIKKSGGGYYQFTVMRGKERDTEYPEVLVSVSHGKLKECSVKNMPAAVQIPVLDAQGSSLNCFLLIPEVKTRIYPTQRNDLPQADTPLHVSHLDSCLTVSKYELKPILRGKNYPWISLLSQQTCEFEPEMTLYLPLFDAPNRIVVAPTKGAYACDLRPYPTDESGVQAVSCRVKQVFNCRAAIRAALRSYAHSARQGHAAENTVAHLYYVLNELNEARGKERRERIIDYYASLFRATQFGDFLRENVLKGYEELMPTRRDIRENMDSVHAASPALRNKLMVRENGELLLEAVRKSFADIIQSVYDDERKKFTESSLPSFNIKLTGVQLNKKGELIWVFELSVLSSS